MLGSIVDTPTSQHGSLRRGLQSKPNGHVATKVMLHPTAQLLQPLALEIRDQRVLSCGISPSISASLGDKSEELDRALQPQCSLKLEA